MTVGKSFVSYSCYFVGVSVVLHCTREVLSLTDSRCSGRRGWQGLLAYSSNYTVVVVDPLTQQLVQTLDKHKALVTKVIHHQARGELVALRV